jgi:ketosteroid isomerase-like protein
MAGEDEGAIVDRLYDALAAGNLPAARDCLTPDALIWHSFDRVVHDVASIEGDWQKLVSRFTERSFVDVRRQATETGLVQQHVMVVTATNGERMAWPACILVRFKDGRISRIDEYIDLANYFVPEGNGPVTAPGL